MGSSSSSSSTSQLTQAINPIALAADNGTAVNGVVNGNGTLTQNITTLNADVANHAMDTTLTATQDALLFGANSEKNSYDFAGKALTFASDSNKTAMSFADASNKAANATTQSAIGSASDAMTQALQFGSRQTGVALDALAGSAQMIDTAYKDAKGVLSTNVIMMGIGATVLIMFFALRKK